MTGDHEPFVRDVAVPADPITEIACDESGSEGDHLIGGETDVFAYASVHMDATRAAEHVQEIRERIGSPALEYKANHLLRRKSQPVLRWLLGPDGPVSGRARVHLTDKAMFVVVRMLDLLVGEVTGAVYAGPSAERRAMALVLYHDGRAAWGDRPWRSLLASFNDLMRVRNRPRLAESADAFFSVLGGLRGARARPGRLGEVIELLWGARPDASPFVARLIDNPETVPSLDPLTPAFVRTIIGWNDQRGPVSIVHDQQALLTQWRIARVREMVGSRLVSLTFVDSRTDPRVQIADFVAGIARTVASAVLHRRADQELATLLAPYVDEQSIWSGDWAAPARSRRFPASRVSP